MTILLFPNSITEIGDHAFSNCWALTSLTIPKSVKKIENGAFYSCKSLASINIENGVTSLGWSVFENCIGLTSVNLGNSISVIGRCAFQGCENLNNIIIPSSINEIDENAFFGCGLKTIIIGNAMINSYPGIGQNAFGNCEKLTDVYCYAENIPASAYNSFDGSYIDYATLHVPSISMDNYMVYEPWNKFKEIVPLNENDPNISGILPIYMKSDVIQQDCISINGMKKNKPSRGINIIRLSNGSTRKVVVK